MNEIFRHCRAALTSSLNLGKDVYQERSELASKLYQAFIRTKNCVVLKNAL